MQNLPKMSVALWCSFALIAGMKFADGGRDPQFLAMVVLWPACYAFHKLTCWMVLKCLGTENDAISGSN